MLVDKDGNVDKLSMLGLCMCVVCVLLYHYVVYTHFRTYVDYQVSRSLQRKPRNAVLWDVVDLILALVR